MWKQVRELAADLLPSNLRDFSLSGADVEIQSDHSLYYGTCDWTDLLYDLEAAMTFCF